MREATQVELDRLKAGHYWLALRAEIQDADGAWVRLDTLGGLDWVKGADWGANIDQPVQSGTLRLFRERGTDATESLAPLIEASGYNRDALGGYAPLLHAGRRLRLYTAVTDPGGDFSTAWKPVLEGKVDKVKWPDHLAALEFRDLGAILQDTQIQEARSYGDAAGVAVETVMQGILDDNNTGVTLYTPTSPGWFIHEFEQAADTNVLDALLQLARQIGWEVRYMYDAADQFRLTFYRPERNPAAPDHTFTADDYVDVTGMESGDTGVRNQVRLFSEDADGNPLVSYREDPASVLEFGPRYMEVPEEKTSNIDTQAELDDLGDIIISDLASPPASQETRNTYFWPVQVADFYRWMANGYHYDTDQDLAVQGYTHTVEGGTGHTDIQVRGKPAGAYKTWLRDWGARARGVGVDVRDVALEWDEDADVLRLVGTGVGRVRSARFMVDDSLDFTSPIIQEDLAMAGEETLERLYGLALFTRGVTYYGRVEVYGGELSGGTVTGGMGGAGIDTAPIPEEVEPPIPEAPGVRLLVDATTSSRTTQYVRAAAKPGVGAEADTPLEYRYRVVQFQSLVIQDWTVFANMGPLGSWAWAADIQVVRHKFWPRQLEVEVRDSAGRTRFASLPLPPGLDALDLGTGRVRPDEPYEGRTESPLYGIEGRRRTDTFYKYDGGLLPVTWERSGIDEVAENLFKRGVDTYDDVGGKLADAHVTSERRLINPDQVSLTRRVIAVSRGAVDAESVDNLFKRGVNTVADVVEDTARAFIHPASTTSGRYVDNVWRSQLEPVGNLFKRGSDTLADVLDSATHRRTTLAEADQTHSATQNLLGADAGDEEFQGREWLTMRPLEDLGLKPGDVISFSAEIRPDVDTHGGRVRLRVYDATQTLIGITDSTPNISTPVGEWQVTKYDGRTLEAAAAFINLEHLWTSGQGASRRGMLNRGPLALPFEEPPFRSRRENADDVTETVNRSYILQSYVDASRRVTTLRRSTVDEVAENLFKRGSDTAADVLATSQRGFFHPGYADATHRPVALLRNASFEVSENLFKRGVDTAADVEPTSGRSFIHPGYTTAAHQPVAVLRSSSFESVDNLFKRGSNTAADVVETAGAAFIHPASTTSGRYVENVWRSQLEHVSNLFKRGSNTLEDVLDGSTHRRTTIAEADQTRHPTQNLLNPDAVGEHSQGKFYISMVPLTELGLKPGDKISWGGEIRPDVDTHGGRFRLYVYDSTKTLIHTRDSSPNVYTPVGDWVETRHDGYGIHSSAQYLSLHHVWFSGGGKSRRVVLNRGTLAMPWEEPPFRINRERMEALNGNVPAGATQSDGTQQRVIAKGHQAGTGLVDGAGVTFNPVFQNPPMILLRGGLTYNASISGDQALDRVPQNVSASGFVLRAKNIRRGSVTTHTDFFASGSITMASPIGSSINCNLDPAGASGGEYTVSYDFQADVADDTTLSLTFAIDTNDGSGWVERATQRHLVAPGSSNWQETVQKQITVTGLGVNDDIRVRLKADDSSYGPQISNWTVDPTTVKYPLSTDTEEPATLAGAYEITYEAMAVS